LSFISCHAACCTPIGSFLTDISVHNNRCEYDNFPFKSAELLKRIEIVVSGEELLFKMGSYSEPHYVFNPATCQLRTVKDESNHHLSSRESFIRDYSDVEFNPAQCKLVATGTINAAEMKATNEKSYSVEEMEFIPSACRLERKTATPLKREIREPSATETIGFDKTMGKLKKEQNHSHNKPATKTTKANQVMVGMNRRGTGGFF